jgi:nucleoside-diphosphate-sugar epimerase
MKALVTGATGFIGSHLVERLLSTGTEVRGLVRNGAGAAQLQAGAAEVAFGDLTDLASLRAAVKGIDVVFHLGARVSDWGPRRPFDSVTIEGTENVLRTASEAGVSRFLHVSSIVVYDDRFTRRNHMIPETAPRGPSGDRRLGNYARAKAAAEEAAWDYARRGQLAVTVVRPALVYGPRDRTTVPRLIGYLKSSNAAWIGRGNPTIDPIFVTDVAECIEMAAASERAIGEAYNAAPAEEIGMREFWAAMCRAIDVPEPQITVPYWLAAVHTSFLEGWSRLTRSRQPPLVTKAGLTLFTHDRHYISTKAQHELGWRPKVDLEEGLRQTAQWLRAEKSIAGR